ncbi:class I SAM-dependent methyltransferase [Inmirania thermothiophila]|uniref:Methyltransferase family protein n=1 Tax=Inmirania thermothiophila TaxID=1750597 RepID=A0A3N1Y607_9GAMM|nr:class I SAM-dependent methyltransferase [Inmirania thermothiophila]ROR34244.1 methyltransferase family protein [Inmirania thermothiophila]
MGEDRRALWDARYRMRDPARARPARVLSENLHLLPARGRALEIACGFGANALLLAARGLAVTAWDLSPVAIAALRERAALEGLALAAAVRDVVAEPPPAQAFDVVVVSYFLERALCPAIAAALRPGGLLFYQTHTRAGAGRRGPRDPGFRLADGELLRLFPGLVPRVYRDEGAVGDMTQGLRGEAYLVAQRLPPQAPPSSSSPE